MKIYAISPEIEVAGEVGTVCDLLEAGLDAYHLRRPDEPEERTAHFLESLPDDIRPRVVLHQKHEWVDEYGLGGYHWKDRADWGECAPEICLQRRTGRSLSRSAHGRAGLVKPRVDWDYIFVSPVFPSISKAGYGSDQSGFEWEQAVRDYPAESLMALGGIKVDTAQQASKLGFAGVVLHGYLWSNEDPVDAFRSVWRALS
ncbi:MAG: thiamine phosphate synthase [Puniceicoccales bacterium]